MGDGTKKYTSYSRQHRIYVTGKPDILGSSTYAFRGDKDRYNPEDLLVASISSCHMLWYLHQCAAAGVVVTAYQDDAEGNMVVLPEGSGHFTSVTLNLIITLVDPAQKDLADSLHTLANSFCFIANSLNFPVHHKATYL